MQLIRNPSTQFMFAFFLTPFVAIAGEAFGGSFNSFLGLLSLLVAFGLTAFTGFRSCIYERSRLPVGTTLLTSGPIRNYIVGVVTLSIFLALGCIIVQIILVRKIIF